MRLFGSSGIRGLVNQRITPELLMDIGSALGSVNDHVIIGRDPRTSGDMAASSLISALLSRGCDVADAGIVSTPTLARASSGFDMGIMVTASHNTAEYNGVKLWNPDGTSFGVEQMEATEKAIFEVPGEMPSWDGVGRFSRYQNAVEEHIEDILATVGDAELDVVVDCGCGAASHITPQLLRRMGCRVRTLNCQPDGHFPGRDPEPTEENVSLLIETVKKTGADIGIAHDGDADRMIAIDDKGRYVSGDDLLAVFGRFEARTRMVVPVNASMAVDDYIEATVFRTKVGDVYISEELKTGGGEFGGEPSGTWVFPKDTYCPDGILAAARLVKLASDERLSELVDSVPKYPLLRGTVRFPVDERDKVVERIAGSIPSIGSNKLTDLDGWRAEFDDGWGLIRLSGTEPKIRITAEARDQGSCQKIFNEMKALAEGCVGP